MLPLNDMNPTRRTPIVTYILIALNVLVFMWELTLNDQQLFQAFRDLAVVPNEINNNPYSVESFFDIVRSMFMHGGFAHIGGNMLYLFLFGDNVEDRFGSVIYLLLYFASGFAATIAQIMIEPTSTIPLVGASGAIAGVLGSYLLLYPTVSVRGLIFFGIFVQFIALPAWIVLIFWFVLQLVNGAASLGAESQVTGGVAFFAHIGGFVAGFLLTAVLMNIIKQPDRKHRENMLYERAQRYRY